MERRQFPADVLNRLRTQATEILDEIAASDERFAQVYANYRDFQQKVAAWYAISEKPYYLAS